MNSKWTYEQRREALNDLHRINEDAGAESYNSSVSYNSDLVDLACQRNELLWALKDVREFVKRNGYDTALVDSAIAKAESI